MFREDSQADPDDQELLWAVQHGCYLSEVFSLLNDNSLETAARQYKGLQQLNTWLLPSHLALLLLKLNSCLQLLSLFS